jgi:dihydropteroate synthase
LFYQHNLIALKIVAQDTAFAQNLTLNLKGRLLSLQVPKVMGVLNITPDSFFKGSRVQHSTEVLHRAEKMITEGANILDIGGYSSRPGAADISEEEELKRVIPAIEIILKHFPETIISIDTFRSGVAATAIDHGALLINDISGGKLDANMYSLVARLQVPYIIMHMRGTPQNMKNQTEYLNIVAEMITYFNEIIFELRKLDVKDIIIDPGFGFAKTIDQNFLVLKQLTDFKVLSCPILTGLSRKSMIYKTLGITAEEALNGSTALHMAALMNGASILRVHDVREAAETIKLYLQVAPL